MGYIFDLTFDSRPVAPHSHWRRTERSRKNKVRQMHDKLSVILAFPKGKGRGEGELRARPHTDPTQNTPALEQLSHPFPNSKIVNLKSQISSTTPIVPSAIAIAVWEEASLFLDAKLPRSWMLDLTRRAETLFRHNP